jgi:hypothetical protein
MPGFQCEDAVLNEGSHFLPVAFFHQIPKLVDLLSGEDVVRRDAKATIFRPRIEETTRVAESAVECEEGVLSRPRKNASLLKSSCVQAELRRSDGVRQGIKATKVLISVLRERR